MENRLSEDEVIYQYVYSINSVFFHFVEIYDIIFIVDAIEKEVINFAYLANSLQLHT